MLPNLPKIAATSRKPGQTTLSQGATLFGEVNPFDAAWTEWSVPAFAPSTNSDRACSARTLECKRRRRRQVFYFHIHCYPEWNGNTLACRVDTRVAAQPCPNLPSRDRRGRRPSILIMLVAHAPRRAASTVRSTYGNSPLHLNRDNTERPFTAEEPWKLN
jgi:hypothetical protein